MIKKILQLPNDSPQKTLIVALALCLVCSIFVSAAAVGLKSQQLANKQKDIKTNILEVAGLMQTGADVDSLFENIETHIVNLKTGEYVTDIDISAYDQRKAAQDPDMSDVLADEVDIARINRQAHYAKVYLVKNGTELQQLILPVHGYGLWSTMYGFIALENDANTVYGIKFYEHGETPGLGGEINNPKWRALWPGKKAFADNEAAISVVRGIADPASSDYQHQIDGLAGATLTSNGVHNLMRFWLGANGFGPYLDKLRSGKI